MLSAAGVNWSDLDVLSDAGVNWIDLASMHNAGIVHTGKPCSYWVVLSMESLIS